jgi:hypothetical protein
MDGVTIKSQETANAIAVALSNGFTHPGSTGGRQAANMHIPGLDPRGKPTHMVEAIKGVTQAIGESIVNLIENDLKCTIIPNDELAALRDEIAAVKASAVELMEDVYTVVTGEQIDTGEL